jgi:hypothetical protein
MAPGFLAIGSQEIRESRLQVSGEMPDKDGDRIPAPGAALGQLGVPQLADGFIAEFFIPAEFRLDRR